MPRGGHMHQRFVATIEQLAQLLLEWAAAGYDTWHACATFKSVGSRKQVNVQALASLWADIDTRLGKPYAPYANHYDAAVAANQFCQKLYLPPPTAVNSGHGLHLYWRLNRLLTLAEWLPYATGLKRLAQQHGFDIDPSRTADAASILRTPETFNFK